MTYKCGMCKQEFESECSDEEAKAELERAFPGISPDDCEVVCDDCYNLLTKAAQEA